MDKNIIKKYLTERFVNEVSDGGKTPGIAVTAAANKKSGKINKDGVKAIDKDVKNYDKSLKKGSEVVDNKFNYNSTEEVEYHNDMEIMNGQEMIEYDREPNKTFLDKAKEGIEGSSRMGNKGGKGMGNAEESWGASSDNFGKDFVKRVKATTKKRDDASDSVISFGDDIETIPKGTKPIGKHSAIQENNKSQINSSFKQGDKIKFTNKNSGNDYYATFIDSVNGMDRFKNDNGEWITTDSMGSNWVITNVTNNNNNNNIKIKESMKRLKFKKEFNGVGNALKMIPEGYRVDNKEFEMTDGTESYKIRWEGTLTEGRAVVLLAADKNMINEDMQRMKHLMGYKSQETLGINKGNSRINENAIFADVLGKTRRLLGESEEIDGQTAPEGEWDDISVPQASDAKKDIEGSTSDDKGTQAPAPKVGEWEDISVPQASDAKKDVEGSVATEAKTNAPAPKVGFWEEIKVSQASDASKDVTMKESEETLNIDTKKKSEKGGVKVPAELVNKEKPDPIVEDENLEDEEEDAEAMVDESIKLMVSESTGKFYIVGATDKPFAVPAQDNAKALKNPKKYISEVFKR